MAQWIVAQFGALFGASLPARVNQFKDPSDTARVTPWHICLARQASGTSLTNNGESPFKKNSFE